MVYNYSESLTVFGLFEQGADPRSPKPALDTLHAYIESKCPCGQIHTHEEGYLEASIGGTRFKAEIHSRPRTSEGKLQLSFDTSDPEITKPVRRAFKGYRGPHHS